MPHRPQGDQLKYFNLNSRFTVGCIGRQYGKSTLAMIRRIRSMLDVGGIHWWVTPIVPQAKIHFKRFLRYYSHLAVRTNKADMEAELFNGSIIQFKGSDDYTNLKGETLDGVTLDECGSMKPEVFSEVIRPMLAVNNGGADLIGTPKGKNWFHSIWVNSVNSPDWSRHHAPSNLSPFFSQAEFDAIKATTTEATFRQEYLAEFLDSGSEVFSNFNECIKGALEEPKPSSAYVLSVDLAKYKDWTVITVWDVARKHMVYFSRFNQIDWSMQESRIVETAIKYNRATIRVDATGVGDPIFERLRKTGLNVDPVRFTAAVKEHLIESLVFAIEKREITFPYIEEMVHELSVFNVEKTKTGNIRYTAPDGYHDDIVISMAMAVDKLTMPAFKAEFFKAN